VSPRARAWPLALVATFTMAISYFDRQALSVLAPTVTKSLRIDETQYGWLASAFSIAYLVMAPLAGRTIDRVGARRGLLAAVLVWSLVAALHALAPGFAILFALRMLLGAAESPSFPGAAQVVHRVLPPGERARGFGVLFTGSSFGAMAAPLIATFLEARFGWRIAFLGTAAIGLLWVPLWLRVAFRREARAMLDLEPEPRQAPAAPTRMIDVVFHPAVLRASMLVLATVPTVGFVLTWGAKYLTAHFALQQRDLGRYLWIPPVFYDLGSIAFGDVASRRSKRTGGNDRLLVAIAMTLAATLTAATSARTPMQLVAWISVAMAGCGGLFAILTSDMMSRVPPSSVSLAGGVAAAIQSLVLIVLNPTIGRVIDAQMSYTTTVLAIGASIVPFSLAWMLWKPPPIVERV
jgi:MFS family permease